LVAGGIALAIMAMISACGSDDSGTVYFGLPNAVAADGTRVIVADTRTNGSHPTGPTELWSVSRDGAKTRLGHATLPQCPDDDAVIGSLRSLSPGRVGAVIECYPAGAEAPSWYYATIDLSPLRSTTVAVLPPYAASVVWNDGSASGWVQAGYHYQICSQIAQSPPRRLDDLPPNWPYKAGTPLPASACAQSWRTTDPGMAPGGHKLFFLAEHFPADKVKNRGLYCFDENAGTVTKIVDGFTDSYGIDVRADQAVVVVAGVRDGHSGLWRVDTSTGQVRQVAAGVPLSPSLAADGAAVVIDRGHVKVIDNAAA